MFLRGARLKLVCRRTPRPQAWPRVGSTGSIPVLSSGFTVTCSVSRRCPVLPARGVFACRDAVLGVAWPVRDPPRLSERKEKESRGGIYCSLRQLVLPCPADILDASGARPPCSDCNQDRLHAACTASTSSSAAGCRFEIAFPPVTVNIGALERKRRTTARTRTSVTRRKGSHP